MKTNLAPIVYFAYSRPEHTKRSLESLAQNAKAKESELIIYADGAPKKASSELLEKIDATREVLRSRKWCGEVIINESAVNRGCDISMISGITDVIKSYGKAIVLEDDLVISSSYLNYMNAALENFKDSKDVFAISGFMYPIAGDLPNFFFNRFMNSWGYGLWERSWDKYESDVEKLVYKIEVKGLVERFNLGSGLYFDWLKRLRYNTDSYDIIWYASIIANDGYVLYPGKSYVRNAGFDLSGVHNFYNFRNNKFLSQELNEDFSTLPKLTVQEDTYVTNLMTEQYKYLWEINN